MDGQYAGQLENWVTSSKNRMPSCLVEISQHLYVMGPNYAAWTHRILQGEINLEFIHIFWIRTKKLFLKKCQKCIESEMRGHSHSPCYTPLLSLILWVLRETRPDASEWVCKLCAKPNSMKSTLCKGSKSKSCKGQKFEVKITIKHILKENHFLLDFDPPK